MMPAKSEKQRRLFGLALAVKRGDLPRSKVSGDVLKIVDGTDSSEKGIFLSDTTGHNIKPAQALISFLNKTIKSGWGLNGNSESEILSLSNMIKEQAHKEEYGGICFLYGQFRTEGISIVNGGLPIPIMVRKDGSVQQIDLSGLYLDSFEIFHKPPYESKLDDGDILFLRTDGVDEGLTKAVGKNKGHENLEEVLRNHRNSSALGVREAILSELGEYLLPNSKADDDVTLVVVKYKK